MIGNAGNSSNSPPPKKLKQSKLLFCKPLQSNPTSQSTVLALTSTSPQCAGLTNTASSASSPCVTTAASFLSKPSSSSSELIQSEPNQPSILYKRDQNNRSFQEGWYKRWDWLDWNDGFERVMCFPCKMVNIVLGQRLFAKNSDSAFISTGFCNWKDATRCFQKHEQSSCHIEAVTRWCAHCKGVNVTSQLNHHHNENQKFAQKMLLKLLSTAKFLSRQGLAFRGHTTDSGNFQLLLRLRCEDDPDLKKWIDTKKSFVSPEIQNEYLQLMSHHILRKLINQIRVSQYYSIIADEVTDQSRQHQLGISIRWVDEQFLVHEDFLALSLLPKGDAETITALIKDFLCRSSLPITSCRGQCYDGASVMAGNVTGVSKRIAEEEPRVVFVHCLAHSLNLALQESSRQWPIYRDMLDNMKDVITLIRASPKRSAVLSHFQSQNPEYDGKSLRPLCPTRWTTREQSIHSLLSNYSDVKDTLTEIALTDTSDAGSKAHGLVTCMNTFVFHFALTTGLIVFKRTESLSKLLQSSTISVSEARKAAELTRQNLQKYREDESWTSLWDSCKNEARRLNLDPPTQPRLRNAPRRFDAGGPPCTQNIEEYHRIIFFQFLDNILGTMDDRLNQPGLKLYERIENTILLSANNATTAECVEAICQHFGSDLDERKLRLNLEMLPDLMEGNVAEKLSDVTDRIKELGSARRLYGELSKLIVLLLVIPVSSATAERSFSSLRILKSYLRSTMSQGRLNHMLLLNVHQNETDSIDLISVARDFISLNDMRRNLFGSM